MRLYVCVCVCLGVDMSVSVSVGSECLWASAQNTELGSLPKLLHIFCERHLFLLGSFARET